MQNELAEIVAALKAGDADRLDAVQDDGLLLQAIDACERESPEGLPEAALRALDLAYGIRLLDLAQAGAHAEEARTYARHLHRVAHDGRRAPLDGHEPRFHARWRGYADLATLLMRVRAHEQQQAQRSAAPESWERLIQLIRQPGPDGIGWSALFDAVCREEIGPRTKGGLTHLLGRMRDAGWVHTVKTGRTVRVFPGPRAPATVADPGIEDAVRQSVGNAIAKGPRHPATTVSGASQSRPNRLFFEDAMT